MKTMVTLAILGITGLAGAAGAEANDGHRARDYRRPATHHRIERRDRRERVWIPARYETRVVGYECGRPITRQVCISEGHWSFRVAACD
ncbi:MAG: hypothetical protein JO332_00660 [Planctomycetaceae bacterium]|nr:hypothetical protein [Planctomycetaceae bacterium]